MTNTTDTLIHTYSITIRGRRMYAMINETVRVLSQNFDVTLTVSRAGWGRWVGSLVIVASPAAMPHLVGAFEAYVR